MSETLQSEDLISDICDWIHTLSVISGVSPGSPVSLCYSVHPFYLRQKDLHAFECDAYMLKNGSNVILYKIHISIHVVSLCKAGSMKFVSHQPIGHVM